MQKKTVESRLPLILECRASGLSDRAWCLKNGINPSTFRWWVKELKKKGKYDIPPAGNKTQISNLKNEVKIELTCKSEIPYSEKKQEKSGMLPVIEINFKFATIKVSNEVKLEILEKILYFVDSKAK